MLIKPFEPNKIFKKSVYVPQRWSIWIKLGGVYCHTLLRFKVGQPKLDFQGRILSFEIKRPSYQNQENLKAMCLIDSCIFYVSPNIIEFKFFSRPLGIDRCFEGTYELIDRATPRYLKGRLEFRLVSK